MARVPIPDSATLSEDTQAFLAKLPALNIFRMLAGGESLLAAFSRFGNHLLYKTELDPILRELAILRVGVLSGATYEVHHHDRIGTQLGMRDELLAAVREGAESHVFDEPQREVLRYTDDLVANVRASDATFHPLLARLPMRELQELTVVIGFYMLVSRLLETFGVEIEAAGTDGIDI
jgi:4-carboxymuconolactone decarboxylase